MDISDDKPYLDLIPEVQEPPRHLGLRSIPNRVLIILACALVLLSAAGGGLLLYIRNDKTEQVHTSQSIPTIKKIAQKATAATRTIYDPWQDYQTGQNIARLSIDYPDGWKIKFRKETFLSQSFNADYRLTFDIAPPKWNEASAKDWLGWGQLHIDVYDAFLSVSQWATLHSPDTLQDITVKQIEKIGDQPAYTISSNVSQFAATIVMGHFHTYSLTYSQNGSNDFLTYAANGFSKAKYPVIHVD